MKYNTTYLSVPIFDLDWLTLPIENDNDYYIELEYVFKILYMFLILKIS